MTDRRSRETSLPELEFNDLNIHLYLTLNYGTASEHLDFDFMVLYNAFVLSRGLTITQNSICTISDLDRSRLSDTRSAENGRIGANTDPEYRIDASLLSFIIYFATFWVCHIYHIPSIMLGTIRYNKTWMVIQPFLTMIMSFRLVCCWMPAAVWGSTGCSSRVCYLIWLEWSSDSAVSREQCN